jgi:Zn-dependent protease
VPFPPLDGAGVLEGFFPRSLGRLYEYLQSIPILGLVGLLLAWNVFPVFFLPALLFVFDLVAGI